MRTSFFYIFFFLCLSSLVGRAQGELMSAQTHEAYNNYVIYSNELVHALHIMENDFAYLNHAFNEYIEQGEKDIAFDQRIVLRNYDYFPVLPRDLYVKLYDDNFYIPPKERGKPLELIGQYHKVVEELEELYEALAQYMESGRYRSDEKLLQGYKYLERIELLYYDAYALEEKLYWRLDASFHHYELPVRNQLYANILLELNELWQEGRRISRGVRAKDRSAGFKANCMYFENLIFKLKKEKAQYLGAIPKDEEIIRDYYEQMINRAELLLADARSYLAQTKYKNKPLGADYHYYRDMLGHYNRYGNGLTALYNKMLDYTTEPRLLADELSPIFELKYPNHPAFDSLRKDSLTDPAWALAQMEKNRRDSLARADSLAQIKEQPPKLGEPSLEGFATNNLIFLIDISSSMDDEEKLPLLKSSLAQLLSLMRKEDNISIIAYSDKAELLLPPISGQEQEKIMGILDELKVRSSSNADLGLQKAYLLARESFIESGNNRIIMATDGNFSLDKKTERLIRKSARKDIQLSIFYFSEKEYDYVKNNLQEIVLWGEGSYNYITAQNAKQALLIEAQSVRNTP